MTRVGSEINPDKEREKSSQDLYTIFLGLAKMTPNNPKTLPKNKYKRGDRGFPDSEFSSTNLFLLVSCLS